jgi:hypothetical protein
MWLNDLWQCLLSEPRTLRRDQSGRRRQHNFRPFLECLEDRALPSAAALQAAYGQLPLAFEVNQGQAPAGVDFVSHGNGYTLSLTPTTAVLALQGTIPSPANVPGSPGDVLQVQLVGANPAARGIGLDELITKSNYLIGNDPRASVKPASSMTRKETQSVRLHALSVRLRY